MRSRIKIPPNELMDKYQKHELDIDGKFHRTMIAEVPAARSVTLNNFLIYTKSPFMDCEGGIIDVLNYVSDFPKTRRFHAVYVTDELLDAAFAGLRSLVEQHPQRRLIYYGGYINEQNGFRKTK